MVFSHSSPPCKEQKGIFMIAKNKEGKDSSGIVGKLLYFEAVCSCPIHGPRITNNVIYLFIFVSNCMGDQVCWIILLLLLSLLGQDT